MRSIINIKRNNRKEDKDSKKISILNKTNITPTVTDSINNDMTVTSQKENGQIEDAEISRKVKVKVTRTSLRKSPTLLDYPSSKIGNAMKKLFFINKSVVIDNRWGIEKDLLDKKQGFLDFSCNITSHKIPNKKIDCKENDSNISYENSIKANDYISATKSKDKTSIINKTGAVTFINNNNNESDINKVNKNGKYISGLDNEPIIEIQIRKQKKRCQSLDFDNYSAHQKFYETELNSFEATSLYPESDNINPKNIYIKSKKTNNAKINEIPAQAYSKLCNTLKSSYQAQSIEFRKDFSNMTAKTGFTNLSSFNPNNFKNEIYDSKTFTVIKNNQISNSIKESNFNKNPEISVKKISVKELFYMHKILHSLKLKISSQETCIAEAILFLKTFYLTGIMENFDKIVKQNTNTNAVEDLIILLQIFLILSYDSFTMELLSEKYFLFANPIMKIIFNNFLLLMNMIIFNKRYYNASILAFGTLRTDKETSLENFRELINFQNNKYMTKRNFNNEPSNIFNAIKSYNYDLSQMLIKFISQYDNFLIKNKCENYLKGADRSNLNITELNHFFCKFIFIDEESTVENAYEEEFYFDDEAKYYSNSAQLNCNSGNYVVSHNITIFLNNNKFKKVNFISNNNACLNGQSFINNNNINKLTKKLSENYCSPLLNFSSNMRFTLVLDMDETLFHFEYTNQIDEHNPNKRGLDGILHYRPGLCEFLEDLAEYYELVIFTLGTPEVSYLLNFYYY